MPVENLTARRVQALKPPMHGRIDYWDANQKNFSIRVSKSGRKTWTICYRFHGRKRRYSLGTFPPVSLADARDRARKALSQVADGEKDPAAEKTDLRDACTFGDLAAEFLKEYERLKKKSVRNYRWMINRHLLPLWRPVKAQDISRKDVRALTKSIAAKGTRVLANRVLALISSMFSFAIEEEWLDKNPCERMKRLVKERRRDRVLSEDEIQKVWVATEKENPFIRALFQLRILTAQRGGEIRHMRWADLDLESAWWTLPREFSKNDRAHRVPLSPQAVEILKTLETWHHDRLHEINRGRKRKKLTPKEFSGWVFPSPRGDDSAFDWEQRAAKRIRESSGVDFRPHDLRRTAASMMSKDDLLRHLVVKRILNHKERDVTDIYDRFSYDHQKRVALDGWGRDVEAIVEEKENKGNVVPITKGQK